MTLCVELDASISILTKFAALLQYYAKNINKVDASDLVLKLSTDIAKRVKPPNANSNAQNVSLSDDSKVTAKHFGDVANKIREQTKLLKTKGDEQRAHDNKQALSAFINFLPHQVIRMRGDLVETGYSSAYRCQKSRFDPFRCWAISGTRGDIILGKASIAKHTDRADNGIVDALEEVSVYVSRHACFGDLEMPPFLYACLAVPYPIAYAAISTLKLEGEPYRQITSALRAKVTSLIGSAAKDGLDLKLDEKYMCTPSERHVRVEWTMEAMEALGDGGELLVGSQFQQMQNLIQGIQL
jgi:hypothetical protein